MESASCGESSGSWVSSSVLLFTDLVVMGCDGKCILWGILWFLGLIFCFIVSRSHVLSALRSLVPGPFWGGISWGWVSPEGGWVCPAGWICSGVTMSKGWASPHMGPDWVGTVGKWKYAFYLTAFLFCFLSPVPPEKLSNLHVSIYYQSSDLPMTTQDCFVQGRQLADTTKVCVYYSWQP